MRRRIFRLLFITLLFLTGIIIVNAIFLPSKQIPVDPIEPVPIDEAAIERLAQAIRIPTVSQVGRIDTSAFYQIDALIRRNYPLTDSLLEFRHINLFSQVFKWRGRNAKLQPILLIGHLDVVPVEEESRDQWREPPFSGKIQDGYIWGRGAMDDKLSVFGWLETAEQLLREGYQPERTVYFAFGHDEEISGKNGAGAIAAYFKRQNIRFSYVLDEGMMIVKEALPGIEAPVALIGVAEKGYVSLKLNVQLKEGGHSSMPPPETAISILGAAIARLKKNPFPMKIDGAVQELFTYAAPEMSLPYKAVFANLWLTKGLLKKMLSQDPASAALLRTTIAPTMIEGGVKENVLPTQAEAVVNFRILPGETKADVEEYVRKTIKDKRITLEVYNPEYAKDPAPVSATNSFGFQVLHKTIRETVPEAVVAPGLFIAITDSYQYLELADDVYRFLPITVSREDIKGVHGINERLAVENYKQLLRFYRQLIINSCR